jgi:tetratricopeptide (TPR) repeat protein
LDQLRQARELDGAISALKQLAAGNPGDATIQTSLGEVAIAKIKSVLETGGVDHSQVAALALQADQNFSEALKIDPTNWEAQFGKASALARWPTELNKGPEVIQQLSNLVTQQETMSAQPEFAQTYVLLGQQYQSAGQTEKAIQIWQQGAAKFPANPTLQMVLSHHVANQ